MQPQHPVTQLFLLLGTSRFCTKIPGNLKTNISKVYFQLAIYAQSYCSCCWSPHSSDVALLFKDLQSRNAVHIMPGGGTLAKSPVAGGANLLGAHHNVQYKSTGPPTSSLSTYNAVAPSVTRSSLAKPTAPSVQLTPSPSAMSVNMSSEQTNAGTSSLMSECAVKQENKIGEETKVPVSVNVPKAKALEDQAFPLGNDASELVQEDQAAFSNTEVLRNQKDMDLDSKSLLETEAENDQAIICSSEVAASQNVNDNKRVDLPVTGGCENQLADNKNSENHIANEELADLPITATDSVEKSDEVSCQATDGEITGGN